MIGDNSPAGVLPTDDAPSERFANALRRLGELRQGAMLEAALAYAAAGWPVFPCDPRQDAPGTPAAKRRGKRPLVAEADKDGHGNKIEKTGGLWRATTDEAQIRAWWRKYPQALIGVPTGKRIGLFVVDLDPRGGERVDEVRQRLVNAVGPLPECPISITQSGGWHLWFHNPPGDIPKNSAKRIPGVDWRGEGGYVIVPPSTMSDGKAYSWLVAPQ
jgi:putative DNA primase/helicase